LTTRGGEDHSDASRFSRWNDPCRSGGRIEVIAIRAGGGWRRGSDGDLIVADFDGCVVIPQAIEAQVVNRALQKVSAENVVREILSKGASIQQVFRDYGIL
jgi:hypothetical protein